MYDAPESIYAGGLPMRSLTYVALFLAFLIACTPIEKNAEKNKQQAQSELLEQIFTDYFQAYLALNPLQATYAGENKFNHLLTNTFSEEHRIRSQLLEEEFLTTLANIDYQQLSAAERLNFDLFKQAREENLAALAFPEHLLPLNQMYNIANTLAYLGSGKGAQPFVHYQDYRNWLARMGMIAEIFAQIEANLAQGLAQGITQPKRVMEKVLKQIEAHLVDDVEESQFYLPLLNFPATLTEEQKIELNILYTDLLTESVLPAYQALAHFIETSYLPQTRTDSYGLSALPQGQEWYAFAVKKQTSTALTADEIHQLGIAEVARIQQEIQQIMAEMEFSGSLSDFFVFTRDDPSFHYSSAEAMLADYNLFAQQIESKVGQLFHLTELPQADYIIRPVEKFRELSASSGSYQAPLDNSPGVFYLNTYALPARPTWAKKPLTLHEAIPGHHYQIALQREMKELPEFRRYRTEVAFVEGWALYAESLGKELGVYDSYDYYGQLIAELWRSIRLVVDTGIHAKGWSFEDVLAYMYANAPVEKARAEAEAERFIALPGQALAYKVGMMHIQNFRQRAEERLGTQFDVRDFHREILRHGSLPLSVLEQEIERWLAEQVKH